MAKTGKFILGAVLGAAAAALLTPISGREARTGLKSAANKRGLNKLIAGGSDLVNSVLGNQTTAARRKTKTKK